MPDGPRSGVNRLCPFSGIGASRKALVIEASHSTW